MDVSLRFCSCCLRKLCPDLKSTPSDTLRFFVPTIDSLSRNYFAYIAIKKTVLSTICDSEDTYSINLEEIADILHLQQGDFPSMDQRKEIEDFYTSISEHSLFSKVAS